MTIGIVTYYRSENYGAMLQSYASRNILKEMGHKVKYVSYWPEHQRRTYRIVDFNYLETISTRAKLIYLRHLAQVFVPKLLRKLHFKVFFLKNIAPHCTKESSFFDVVVYGSDQIWRKQPFDHQFNLFYFGDNAVKCSRKVALAASMGSCQLTPDDNTALQRLLPGFSHISVREDSLLELLHSIGLNGSELILDPTLIARKSLWDSICPKTRLIKERYLLSFDLLGDCFSSNETERIAKERGLTLITLVGSAEAMPTRTMRTVDGPLQFLNLIKNADLVLTSSYHCMLFSIIWRIPFYASFSTGIERAVSLLRKLGLEKRLITPGGRICTENEMVSTPDIERTLELMREASMTFLGRAIGRSRQ